jgi:transposase
MKDRLEQFIEDNRDSFDSFNAVQAEKVWGKIAEGRKDAQRRKILLRYFIRAAGVLLIFSLSYLFHDFVYKNKEARISKNKINDIYNQIPELKEAEAYYASLVSIKMNEVKPFLSKNPQIRKYVNLDLSELDSIYISLKNDLKDNIDNEQIIEAMIQNYRLRLSILEELEAEIKQENAKDHAKPKITI